MAGTITKTVLSNREISLLRYLDLTEDEMEKLEGGLVSSQNSDTLNLTEITRVMDEIIADERMDKREKIEKLEALLSLLTGSTTDQFSSSSADISLTQCVCSCHDKNKSPRPNYNTVTSVACQTYSTGDIVISKIFLTEEEKERIDLSNSPKK